MTDIAPMLVELDHDLGSCWSDTTLVRRGMILDLVTSIDFGHGDPFDGSLREELGQRLAAATSGHVNQVTWRFRGYLPKPFRRAKSTDCDVFHAGDPDVDFLPEAAQEISQRFSDSLSLEAQVALQALGVAAVSQHRVWFVAADKTHASAVGTTPGARFELHDAVRRWQKGDPLFSIFVDGDVSQGSHHLT